jgi:hypothetical protein
MTADRVINVQFVPDVYSVTVTISGKGSVARTPDQATYPAGSSVNLQALPAPGWTFTGWSGEASGAANPIDLSVTHAMVVGATFADLTPPTVLLTSPAGGDSLSVGDTLTVRWTATDLDGVQSVDLWLVRPIEADSVTAIAVGIPNSGAVAWTVPSFPATQAYVRVVARDSSGNTTPEQNDTPFTIRGLNAAPVAGELLLALLPPTPNPAVGRLQMSFTLPEAAPVRLMIVDVTGREVATLVDGERPPGRHRVVWEARGGRAAAAPGVYFARLQVGREQRVRRFVLAP